MVVVTGAKRPMELTVGFADWQVVDACDAALHQTVIVKFPVLIAIGPDPVSGVVMTFVSKTHGDPVAGESPELLDQPVIEFPRSFAS